MINEFFLTADEYHTEPDAQKCRLLKLTKTINNQQLLDVEINPTLPGELARQKTEISRLLLGFVTPAYKLEDIERGDFMVHIYVPQSHESKDVYDPRELFKIGVGGLHPTLEDALDWNSRNKL